MEKALLIFRLPIQVIAFLFFLTFQQLSVKGQVCCPKFKFSAKEQCEKDSSCNSQAQACKGTTKTYSVYPVLTGYTYQWTVIGGSPSSYTGNEISVTWGTGSTASISVVVTQNFGGTCKDSFGLKLCLVNSPLANFTTSTHTLCVNQNLLLTNTSSGGSYYEWNFGDGTSYVGASPPLHEYTTAGTYFVSLHISNNPHAGTQVLGANDCFCQDIKRDTIVVTSGLGPKIDTLGCYGTLCAADTPTTCYSTPTSCSSYSWSAVGGTIVSGLGTNSICVKWSPTYVGPPAVTLTVPPSCSGGCVATTTIQAPILYPNLPIIGASIVCEGSINPFTLGGAGLPGTYYKWQVTGLGSFTYNANPYNSESVTITAYSMGAPGTYVLTCNYYDSLKMCGGTATKTVTVLPLFKMSLSSTKICEGDPAMFVVNGLANWQVFQNGVALGAPYSGAAFNNTTILNQVWNTPGTYLITATTTTASASNFCNNTASAILQVAAKPILTTIHPLTENICKGDIIKYHVNSTQPSYPCVWTITGGTLNTILVNDDTTVTVKWGSGAGTLSVFQKNPDDPMLVCSSDTITFTSLLWASPTFVASPSAPYCEDDVVTFTATPSGMGAGAYDWTVVGGSILSGQFTSSIQVLWAGGGTHSVSLATCAGVSGSISYVVNSKSIPVVTSTPSSTSCAYSLSCNLLAGSYDWYLNGGSLSNHSQTITASVSGYYTCQPIGICAKAGGIAVVMPTAPALSIHTPITRFCVNAPYTMPSILLTSSLPAGSYSYLWLKNGFPAPGINNAINYTIAAGTAATVPGVYSLEVTYSTLMPCTITSNSIVIDTSCVNGTSTCTLPNLPSFTLSSLCNNYTETFSTTPPLGTTIDWSFGDGTPIGTSLSGAGITHVFSHPGIYEICAKAVNSSYCSTSACFQKTINFSNPNFSVSSNCSVGFTTLQNTTEMLSGTTGYTVSWTTTGGTITPVGSPANSATFTGSGTVTMTVTDASGCTYSKTKFVSNPSASVSMSISPSPTCKKMLTNFTASSSAFANYTWSFGDGTSAGTSTTTHSYNSASSFPITLTVVDYIGCTASASSTLLVNPSPAATLTGDTTFCEGGFASLTAGTGTHFDWNIKEFVASAPFMPYLPTTTLANNNVNQEGTYIVLVTDVNDCQHYSNKLTVLKRPLPKYTVSLSQSIVCLGTTSSAIINASVTPHTISSPYSYLWSVSSPLTVLSPIAPTTNVNIPLGTPVGTYFLYLTVKNDSTGCIKLDTFCIDVRSAPSVNITPTSTICAGNPTLLIPSPNNTTMYDYVWNNGPTSPTQLVSLFGIYELTIIDKATGCSAVSNQVVVNPVPDLHLFPIGCDSLCSFDHLYIPLANNSNPTGPSFLYPTKKWYVNGVLVGNMDFLPLAAYVNTSIVVHVEVSNNYGCSSTSADYHIFVKNCDSCTASAMFTHSIMGFTSTFTNTSTSNGTATYYWTFGDGASSSATSPSHTYAAHGIYTVCLHEYNVTSSDTCVDSLCMNICICSDTFCCDSFLNYLRFKTITTNFVTVSSVQFIPPLLLPTDIVQWDFDCNGIIDNVTTGNTAVTFAYPSTGHYTVCATVLRLQGGDTCWATLTKSITITGKQCSCDTSFTSNVAAGFAVSSVGTTVTYVPLALTNCDTISWNFDDGTAIVHSVGNASVVHTYSAVNSYYVCMTVQRAGSPNCVKTYCRKVLVKPCVCDTSFAGNVASGFATSMAGTTVTFVPIALTNCDTITWDFGDGTGAFTSVGNASIVHVFTSLNAYYVCMRVVRAGSLNCVNTFCKKVTVTSIQKVVLNNLKIYPNPANDFITIDASAVPENTIAQISFFDITGRKLFTEEWKEEASQSINVSSYTSGVYILSIETKEGRLLNNFRIEKY